MNREVHEVVIIKKCYRPASLPNNDIKLMLKDRNRKASEVADKQKQLEVGKWKKKQHRLEADASRLLAKSRQVDRMTLLTEVNALL